MAVLAVYNSGLKLAEFYYFYWGFVFFQVWGPKIPYNLREFVLTHTILAPGACGGGVRAAVPDTASGERRDPVESSGRLDSVARLRT